MRVVSVWNKSELQSFSERFWLLGSDDKTNQYIITQKNDLIKDDRIPCCKFELFEKSNILLNIRGTYM